MLGYTSAKATLDTCTDPFGDHLDGISTASDRLLAPTLVYELCAKHAIVADQGRPAMKENRGLTWVLLSAPPARFELAPLPPESDRRSRNGAVGSELPHDSGLLG